jgi:RNA polymerase sigma-70 factor (ECF subfamily)
MSDVPDALEELYRAQFPRFARLAHALLGDRDLARDAVQEAFVRALRHSRKLRKVDSLEAWMWRTVTNVCLDERRRRRPVPLETLPETASADADPLRELRGAVARLPERQRLALFLRHYADLDYEGIAAVMQVDRGAVAASLHAAHATLRKRLEGAAR